MSSPPIQPQPRAIGAFGNIALAMSTICILAGGITSFHVGFCSVGGAAIGLGWPLGCLFALVVGLTMGEVASAYPRAGGPFLWGTRLSGEPAWGWVAGCFNLAGLITAIAAVNRGLCDFVIGAAARWWEIADPQTLNPWIPAGGAALITVLQAMIAWRGMWLTSRVINVSGVLIVVFAFVLTACVLGFALAAGRTPDLARLVAFENFSGPAGKDVWPVSNSLLWLFLLGLLLPAYTVTGFDSAAQTAEASQDPGLHVPRGIVRAVLISGVAGWVMLAAMILAAPDLSAAAAEGSNSFFAILRAVVEPRWIRVVLYAGIELVQFACGLATLTAAAHLTRALARENLLPASGTLSRATQSDNTPRPAIGAVCGVAVLFILFVSYTAIAAVCATFLYIAYVVPTTWGIVNYRRLPRRVWSLGWLYRPLAVACVVICGGLVVISIQPPNEVARPIVEGMVVLLIVLWFGWTRHQVRHPKWRELATALRDVTVSVAPLGDGLTNRNFRVDRDGETYVLRLSDPDSSLLGIDRESELVCANAAHAAGVAPEIIASLPDRHALVTRFVHGKQLTPASVNDPVILTRIARTMRLYHSHPVPEAAGSFSVFASVREYHRLAEERGQVMPPQMAEALALLDQIERQPRPEGAPCLCHNDLLPANFLDEGTVLRVIDWEYAGVGDRFFDLGNFAANGRLDSSGEQLLLAGYYAAEPVPANALNWIRLMRVVSDLRESAWSYLSARVSKVRPESEYLARAAECLQRFLDGMEGVKLRIHERDGG